MSAASATFPEAVFLRRPDATGYGFFYHNENDFLHAADSFVQPILRSFAGEPVPNQPDPEDHLKAAIVTFLGQAFERTVPAEVGPEGVSRVVAAAVRRTFTGPVPRIVILEQKESRIAIRPGIEFLRHPGHPLAVVIDADAHGGEAHFFTSAEQFRQVGQRQADSGCWLPQLIYRLYERTPSVMAGRPMVEQATGRHSVECRGLSFGLTAPLIARNATGGA